MHHEAKRLNKEFENQADFVLYEGKKLPFEDETLIKYLPSTPCISGKIRLNFK
jgi:hypothetical protein